LRNSMSGPDWTDIVTLMRAIGSLHSAHVALTISPLGDGSGGTCAVAAGCIFDVLPGSSLPGGVMCDGSFPCKEHSTIEAHCFSLLYDLDHEISKVYKNEELWK